jgi:hypothetical protein
MQGGRVCIAGYTKEKRCIRPILRRIGIDEGLLFRNGQLIVYPFALIELDLLTPDPQPPHTEDILFDPSSLAFIRQIHNREQVLQWSLYESVEALFGQPVLQGPGFYVKDCQGERSIGTIQPQRVIETIYERDHDGAWDYRLTFVDGAGELYRLKITDLTWHDYCDSLRGPESAPAQIATQLTQILAERQVYLRIGLARGWNQYPDRCYLQITGVYTFPDYLDGKTFVDFAADRVLRVLARFA